MRYSAWVIDLTRPRGSLSGVLGPARPKSNL